MCHNDAGMMLGKANIFTFRTDVIKSVSENNPSILIEDAKKFLATYVTDPETDSDAFLTENRPSLT